MDFSNVFLVSLFLSLCQSLLLSVWLHREKDVLKKPEEIVRNLHTLLITLSNMKGMLVLWRTGLFARLFLCWRKEDTSDVEY